MSKIEGGRGYVTQEGGLKNHSWKEQGKHHSSDVTLPKMSGSVRVRKRGGTFLRKCWIIRIHVP